MKASATSKNEERRPRQLTGNPAQHSGSLRRSGTGLQGARGFVSEALDFRKDIDRVSGRAAFCNTMESLGLVEACRVRLFAPVGRIQGSMSAQAFTLNAARSPLLFAAVMTDDTQALAQGLRRRDPDLLDRLIELYQQRLYRYLLFLTGNPHLAEDLFQETWVRVLERGHQYNAKSKFESWLFAIARNLVIDVARRKKMPSLEDLGDPESNRPYDPPDEHSSSALQLLVALENQQAVQMSLLKIPAYYREVLLLRFHEEMGLEEIAAVLSTPISTVKSRLYRGLAALKTALPEGAV
jgi:RNA polymerase sigma-70 factor, ECF subfamily